VGYAIKGAAQALLAKVYAQEGKYQPCLDYCNKVTTSGQYSLEGNRWNDLLRYGQQYTINLMKTQVDPTGKPLNYNVTATKMIFPVPFNEIQLDGNLIQNPGY
jgi:hypothetical protein